MLKRDNFKQTLNVGGGGVPRRGRGGAIGGMNRFGNATVAASNVANNRTLQVRKIPAEMNNIAKLNEHFANFGQIVNIQARSFHLPVLILFQVSSEYFNEQLSGEGDGSEGQYARWTVLCLFKLLR